MPYRKVRLSVLIKNMEMIRMDKKKKEKIEKLFDTIKNAILIFFIGVFFAFILSTPKTTTGTLLKMIWIIMILHSVHLICHH